MTTACAAEPSVIARRRRKSARQCAGSCAKGSQYSAAQRRDASRRDESNKAARAPETWALSVTRVFQILGHRVMFLKRWPVCASERRVSARRRLSYAWQFVWPRTKGSHLATQGRDASQSDEPNKAVRAQGGVALSVTRVFRIFGHRIMFLKR